MKFTTKNWTTKWITAGVSFSLLFSTSLAFQANPAKAADAADAADTASVSTLSRADRVIQIGNRYLGVPYKWGSPSGVTKTFDCSSFTQYVYKQVGISLPRTSTPQSKRGVYVARKNLRKGDLVFFSTPQSNGKLEHVAIYAGNGKILHTYGAGGVKYSNLNSTWWSSHYITARRVL